MKKRTIIILLAAAVLLILGGYLSWGFFHVSNPWNARTLGDIPTPAGFSRVGVGEDSFGAYLRKLPLRPKGTKVHLYTGKEANYQFLSAGVVDLPLLSNSEQCADVTIRLRAEYLWLAGRYKEIAFRTLSGKKLAYERADLRESFEAYLKKVYDQCNTTSVFQETQERALSDIQPGDVLVYTSRRKGTYGHAILVADVARNARGKIAVLCVEGNTPARDIHIVRHTDPFRYPWAILEEGSELYRITVFRFHPNELRHY